MGGGGGGGRRKSEDSVSPRYFPTTNAIAVSTAVLGQSHKDNVCCTAVEEQLEAKEVQLSQPSSTSLLMISSGLMKVQLHLPPLDLLISPGTLCSLSLNTSIYRFVSTHLPYKNSSTVSDSGVETFLILNILAKCCEQARLFVL